MTKLNKKRITYIVSQAGNGKKTALIARELCVSQRRVQQIYRHKKLTGSMLILKKERRPRIELTEEQKQLIYKTHLKHKVGAKILKIALDEDYPDNRISKNKIHDYLKQLGFSKSDKKKQKQRKRCRYERKHSCSLGHMDSYECKWDRRKKLIGFLDDASRKVLAAGEFSRITANNAVLVMKEAIKEAGEYNSVIRQVNTDRGTEFMSNHRKEKKRHAFLALLDYHGIKHIPSRVKNPQTNGKLERWHQEYEKHRISFAGLGEFVGWYNDRIHGEIRTRPNRAFIHKLRPESLLGLFFRRLEDEAKK